MNVCHIVGNLCNDPELRATKNGKPVTNFTVAVNRRDGQETEYFCVTAWDRRAENCATYLHKGDKVAVTGPISVSSYISPDGNHHARLQLRGENIEFVSRKVIPEENKWS